jgi:predicted anti-sigma-YlaC factor YlaD
MGREPSASACERARTWAALRPDGELSTIELRLLDAHLDGCADCRLFAETVSGATRLVRETEDEAPAFAFDLHYVRRSRLRRAAGTAARSSVAAAAVLVAFAIGVVAPGFPGKSGSESAPRFAPVLTSEPNMGELLRSERSVRGAQLNSARRGFGPLL